jgi:hypothetical protein
MLNVTVKRQGTREKTAIVQANGPILPVQNAPTRGPHKPHTIVKKAAVTGLNGGETGSVDFLSIVTN